MLVLAVTILADDRPFDFTISQSVQSAYIWRGFNLGEVVNQGSGNIHWWELDANIWYNLDFDVSDINEVDYSFSWTHIWPILEEKFWTELGYIYYNFHPHELSDTAEVVFGIGLDVFLNPVFTLYHDFDEGEGAYFLFGGSHAFPVNDWINLCIHSEIGINDELFIEDSGFAHWNIGASLPMAWQIFNGDLTVAPNVDVSVSLDDDNFDDEVWGGITATMVW